MPDSEEPAFIEDDDKAAEALRFQHQCYLAANWGYFANHNKGRTYKNFVCLDASIDPTELTERLTAVPNAKAFIDAPPVLLSALVPKVEIFKVMYPTASSKGVEIPLKFSESQVDSRIAALNDVGTVTQGQGSRGQGVGLKSFEWTLSGKNPGEANSSIEAKMTLLFSTMEDFIMVQGNAKEYSRAKPAPAEQGPDVPIKWLDLIFPEHQSKKGVYNSKFFRVKAKVGYYPPNPAKFAHFKNATECMAAAKAVANTSTTLFLTLVSHDLSFSENGQVELELSYQAALEGAMSNPLADVFLLGDLKTKDDESGNPIVQPTSEQDRQTEESQLRREISEAERCKGKGVTEEQASDTKEANNKRLEEIEEARREDRANKYRKILTRFEDNGVIFNIKVKHEDIGQLRNKWGARKQLTNEDAAKQRRERGASAPDNPITGGTRPDMGNLSKNASEAAQEKSSEGGEGGVMGMGSARGQAAQINDAKEHANKQVEELQIDFFYFGDLLEIALQVLHPVPEGCGADPSGDIRPIVGSYSFSDPFSGNQKKVCLADIPIALESFKVWFLENIVKPNRISYPVKAFINDLITGLVSNAMSPKCFGADLGFQVPSVQQVILTAPLDSNGKDRIIPGCTNSRQFLGRVSRKAFNAIKILESTDGGFAQANYFILSTSSAFPTSLNAGREGAEEEDAKKGRYWLRFGVDKGLVKEVKFKKQDQPGAREMRMEQQSNGEEAHFHEIYDADISLYGCPFFRTGMLVYVDRRSSGVGNPAAIAEIAGKLNLGGYYVVIEVSSSIEAGKFETDLKTIWTAPGDGKAPRQSQGQECSPTVGGSEPGSGGGGPAVGDTPSGGTP